VVKQGFEYEQSCQIIQVLLRLKEKAGCAVLQFHDDYDWCSCFEEVPRFLSRDFGILLGSETR
jgi:hypothetical protein